MRTAKITHEGGNPLPEDTVCRVIGTMSGTSCDGVDLAFLELSSSGHGVQWLDFVEWPYPSEWAGRLRKLGTLSDAEALLLETEWTDWLAERIVPLMEGWTKQFGPAHLLGFSGHTWYHEPGGRGTRAIGDAMRLHRRLGVPVVADYRGADVAAGGQGAPLVPLFDAEVFPDHVACLNLGGIANATLLVPGQPVVAADLCGCNLLLNHQARRSGLPYDRDGTLQAAGVPDSKVLAALTDWDYLHRPWPKSLAAEDLEGLHAILDAVPRPEDAIATAVEWIATSVAAGLEGPGRRGHVLVTGGGAHHPGLLTALRDQLGSRGFDVDVPERRWTDGKEAAAFAWLALRTALGRTTSLASVTGAKEDVCGGALYGNFTAPGMNGHTPE